MARYAPMFLLFLMACTADCSSSGPPLGNPDADAGYDAGTPDEVTLRQDGVRVYLIAEPFTLTVAGPDGDVLTTYGDDGTAAALIDRTIRLKPPLLEGFEGYDRSERTDGERILAKEARIVEHDDTSATVLLTDPDVPGEAMRLTVQLRHQAVRIDLESEATVANTRRTAAAMAFTVAPDEKFVGLGERESSIDHRGKRLYNWTEEGGIGLGEDSLPGPGNPIPNGEGMTHLPVPFTISSAGYGLWLDTTHRSEFDFDSGRDGTLRVSADEPRLGIAIAVARDPKDVLRAYTADTGRATLPAPWVFGPRKRVNDTDEVDGVPEIQALRDRDIAMTAVDDTVHFLPHGSHLGREAELREWTALQRRLGYMPIAYLNPHISTERPGGAAYLAHAREHDALVLHEDGTEALTKIVSGGLQEVATIDFTAPAGRHFYEEVMAEVLDLGYAGWMQDFGEYLPHDAVLADGRTGAAAHNDYPLQVQRTVRDFLERERPGDYLFFVRSGYAGTQALVPMVWSGDPTASFAPARGLPAQVRAGISAGLSGIPYWGSDGTGFTCLQGPADKEVSLRWMAFAALSPDMHEQDACAQRPDGTRKWTMWDDEESTRLYGVFTRLHTRLFPYIYAAARESAQSGIPIMRHALLMHPDMPAAWEPQEEYYFGPALYAAPVVERGATERELWLPPGDWFDWYTLEHVRGDARVTRPAPLGEIPLWLRAGGIVPMLDADVDTLAPADDPSVTDMDDRAGVLDVRAAVTTAAPQAGMGLVDGTTLMVELEEPGVALPTGFRRIDDETELRTCDRCAMIDSLPDGTTRLRANFPDGEAVRFGGLMLGALRDRADLTVRWDVLVR